MSRLFTIISLYIIELKSGRIPDGVTKRLGFWKAEEYQKFTYPASEYVLGGLIPDEEYQVWITIVRITEMVYIARADVDGMVKILIFSKT